MYFIKKTCESCQIEYNAKKSKQKYCSVECKKYAMRSKIKPKICPYCNTEFIVKDYRASQKYCSIECRELSRKAKTYDKTCEYCNKRFIVTATYKKQKYCSTKCADEALRDRIITTCTTCGISIEVFPSQFNLNGNGNFCSRECVSKFMSENFTGENNPTYCKVKTQCGWCKKDIYIIPSVFNVNEFNYCSRECMGNHYSIRLYRDGSPSYKGGKITRSDYGCNWRIQRKNTRKRDNFICQICGKTEKANGEELSVHHIRPFRNYDTYIEANKLSNLVSICRSCHDFVHSNSNTEKIFLID